MFVFGTQGVSLGWRSRKLVAKICVLGAQGVLWGKRNPKFITNMSVLGGWGVCPGESEIENSSQKYVFSFHKESILAFQIKVQNYLSTQDDQKVFKTDVFSLKKTTQSGGWNLFGNLDSR